METRTVEHEPRPPAPEPAPHAQPAAHGRWRWFLALGAVQIVIGGLALSSLFIATLATVLVFGMLLLAAGLTQIVLASTSHRWRGFSGLFVTGVVTTVFGFMLVVSPVVGAGALTLLLAAWLLVAGVAQIGHSLVERYPRWGWSVVSGVVSTALGLLVLSQWPISAVWFLGLAIGVALAVSGINFIGMGLAARHESPVDGPRPAF
jgi:uncharacterized membrane protein HdeD (DUF308 family)